MIGEHVVMTNLSLHVKNEGAQGGRFLKIQDAIDHAEDGDSIFIMPGTYLENIVINKRLNIYSDEANYSVVVGNGLGPTITVRSDSGALKRLTVTGGGANYSGIFLDGLAGTYIYEVDRCVVTGNKNGIELDGSSNNLITNNMCVGNVEYGIKLVNGSNANNIIANWGISNLHGFGMFDAVPTPAGIRNLVVDQISYLNTGAGLRIVDCVGDAIMNYIGNLNDIGMSVEGCDVVTVAGQIIDHSATYGVRVTNSNDCQFNLMTRLSGVKDIFIDEDSERIILLHSVYGTISDLGVDTYSEANHAISPENDLDVGTVRYVKEEAMRSCSQYYLMMEARENGSLMPYDGDAGLFDLDGLGDLMPATGINPDIDINYELDGLGDIQSLA